MSSRTIRLGRAFAYVCLALPLLGFDPSAAHAAKPKKKKDTSSEQAEKPKKGKKKAAESEKSEEASQKKVAVGKFKGAKSGEARKAVIATLKKDGGYEVTDAEDIKADGKDSMYLESARALGVDAIIVGNLKKGKLVLTVRNGADGSKVDDFEIEGGTAPKLKKNIQNTLAVTVADAVASTKAPAPEEPEEPKEEEEPAKAEGEEEPKPEEAPVEETPAESTEASSEDATLAPQTALAKLEVIAGLRALNRNFEFKDSLADLYGEPYETLNTYELPLAPMPFVDLAIYPLSFGGSGFASNIGIVAGYEKLIGTQSVFGERTEQQVKLDTSAQQWYAGVHVRVPFDVHYAGLMAAYGNHTFSLLGDEVGTTIGETYGALVPDVDYSFIRLRADGRLRFGEVLVGGSLGARFVMDAGSLKNDWFPNTHGQALEFGVMAGYEILRNLDVVAGFDYVRYGFDFNPLPDPEQKPANISQNVYVGNLSVTAGGATDTYVSGWLGLRFHLPVDSAGDGATSVKAEASASTEAEAEAE